MFIAFVLIENCIYISTGIIRGFEDYIRIQEGQLRIHLVLNLTFLVNLKKTNKVLWLYTSLEKIHLITSFKCSFCKKAFHHKQNSTFCNSSNHWVHAECADLNIDQFITLSEENDNISWCCPQCILDSFPFQIINDCF